MCAKDDIIGIKLNFLRRIRILGEVLSTPTGKEKVSNLATIKINIYQHINVLRPTDWLTEFFFHGLDCQFFSIFHQTTGADAQVHRSKNVF